MLDKCSISIGQVSSIDYNFSEASCEVVKSQGAFLEGHLRQFKLSTSLLRYLQIQSQVHPGWETLVKGRKQSAQKSRDSATTQKSTIILYMLTKLVTNLITKDGDGCLEDAGSFTALQKSQVENETPR